MHLSGAISPQCMHTLIIRIFNAPIYLPSSHIRDFFLIPPSLTLYATTVCIFGTSCSVSVAGSNATGSSLFGPRLVLGLATVTTTRTKSQLSLLEACLRWLDDLVGGGSHIRLESAPPLGHCSRVGFQHSHHLHAKQAAAIHVCWCFYF